MKFDTRYKILDKKKEQVKYPLMHHARSFKDALLFFSKHKQDIY